MRTSEAARSALEAFLRDQHAAGITGLMAFVVRGPETIGYCELMLEGPVIVWNGPSGSLGGPIA